MHFPLTNILLLSGAGGHISEEEILTLKIVLAVFASVVPGWGLFVLIKYSFIRGLIRAKMRWSRKNDSFWNYDHIIEMAKECYIKAQLFLHSSSHHLMPYLNVHAQARMEVLKKNIESGSDLEFINAYICSFIDRKNDALDEVTVYFEIYNAHRNSQFKEIVIFRRDEEGLIMKDVIKHPTMYIITHRRSIIEKF